jgi:DNA-binding NarL/FixJ family response regulator
MILLLCDDLLFASRITSTARVLDFPILTANSVEKLLTGVRENSPSCVILDLAIPGSAIGVLLRQLREECATTLFVAAFGSHVDTDTLRAAREAGCDVVWPRSKFVEELESSLPAWVNRPS